MNIQYIDTILHFPIFLYFYKKNKEFGRLFFYIVLSSLSFYEFIDKKMYYFQYNDLNEYNYIGDKCRIIVTQYFLVDIFFVTNKPMLFHHILILIGLSWSYYLNQAYYLTLYLCLNEISSIFLALNILNIYPKYSNLCFMITFFIFRILLLPILTYIYNYNNVVFTILFLDNCLHGYWVITLSKKILIK
jgi:hypothetical protein|tara:strand:+ start:2563 stop:3129 length:567 start_codon:yes stop_codon:yes gene_type:complete